MKAALRHWLRAPGSLSRHLAALGRFEVQTLHEGPARLLPGEARDLGRRDGRHWVREVVLRVDGAPCVWARSVTPCRAVSGPWRALRALGSRPLAALLFEDRRVRRSALRAAPHRRGGRWHRCADAAWHRATGAAWPSSVAWGRSSVFMRRGARLRVCEAFVPVMKRFLGMSGGRTRA